MKTDDPPTLRVLLQDTVEAWSVLLGKERMVWRPESFVLRNANVEGRGAIRPPGMRKGKAKQCFANASHICMASAAYDYVEGFACNDDISFPFLHAWLIRKVDGLLVDPTLADPSQYQHLGIRITHDQLIKELMRLGHYGMLELQVRVNLEFMQRFEADRNRA